MLRLTDDRFAGQRHRSQANGAPGPPDLRQHRPLGCDISGASRMISGHVLVVDDATTARLQHTFAATHQGASEDT